MTLQEALEKMEGSYAEVLERLPAESLVIKLMGKFLADDSLEKLETAVSAGDFETVFKVTHNLKGVCANLGMTGLQTISSKMCEATRNGAPTEDLNPMLDELRIKYNTVKETITELTA